MLQNCWKSKDVSQTPCYAVIGLNQAGCTCCFSRVTTAALSCPTGTVAMDACCAHCAAAPVLCYTLLQVTFVVRGSHLKATSLSQPVLSSAPCCSWVRGSITRRKLGKYVGNLRHILLLLL